MYSKLLYAKKLYMSIMQMLANAVNAQKYQSINSNHV